MRRTRNIVTIALILCMLAGAVASAKVKNQLITFGQEFTIGGTLIKPGTYRLSFDDQTNELTVAEKKSKAVVAKVTARAERRQAGGPGTGVQMIKDGDSQVFVSIAFPDDNRVIRVGESPATTAAAK